MKNCKIVVLSPHHADRDYRVRRSIEIIAELFEKVDVFWDADYGGHQHLDSKSGDHVREMYTRNKDHEFLRLIFGRKIFSHDVLDSILSAEVVYIHASGIEGLLYCRTVKRINSACHVVFDYHDSLTYELFYQFKKIGLAQLYKPTWKIYQYYLKRLMASVDSLVGISNTQINDFQQLLGRELVTTSVPNFRAFSPRLSNPRKISEDDEQALVWLGSVMQGRDLSLLAEWISQLPAPPKLHVFGNIINQSAVSELQLLIGDRVSFYGEFKNEDDIYPNLPNKVIGVFLGWDDPQGTNINSHASPNKYFTYVNMELPVIINRSLSELAEAVSSCNAGIAVANQEEFANAVEEIAGDYSQYVAGAKKLKQYYGEIDPKQSIAEFLQIIKKNTGCDQ